LVLFFLFVSAEKWNTKYVAALLPVLSNMVSFQQTSEVYSMHWQV
jgi:hypothetical protein